MSPLLFFAGWEAFFRCFLHDCKIYFLFLQRETKYFDMNRRLLILLVNLLFCCVSLSAQDAEKSELQKRAESNSPKENVASTRSSSIRAFNDYANQGKIQQAVECAVKAAALYYKENLYQEAFDLLRRADQTIAACVVSKVPRNSSNCWKGTLLPPLTTRLPTTCFIPRPSITILLA